MATEANSNAWVRTYNKADGTEYQIAYRTNTIWSQQADGSPTPGSFQTNLQNDLIAIDKGITGGGTGATWTTSATRGVGAKSAWTRKHKDDAATDQGFVIPDDGWLDLQDRKSNFSSQVNNNAANSIAKTFKTSPFGRDNGLGTQAGAMREILTSQGSGNQGNPIDAGVTGNRVRISSLQESTSQTSKTRESYGTDGKNKLPLYYPAALRSNRGQDRLSISVLEYKPREIQKNQYKLNERASFTERIVGQCILPVPGGVGDQNSVSWGPNNMNPMELATANLAFDTIKDGDLDAARKKLESTISSAAGKDSPEVKEGLAAVFTQSATNQNILTRKTGKIVNPNMELLFNAPVPRPFAFTYRMSPRSREESVMVKKIIRMFKQSMSVQRSQSRLFLKSPNTYKLQWLTTTGKREHEFLPRIKECALQAFNVNYTPDGNYATYEDSSMISYEVQFSFQELEPVYNDDYSAIDKNRDTSIGY